MTLKDEHPRSAGVQYATGEGQRNGTRMNEVARPKWKQCLVWMCLIVKIKSAVIKNNIT